MIRNSFYILITLFLLVHIQSLCASTTIQVSDYHSLELPMHSKYVLPGGSESSGTTLLSEIDDDFIILAITDIDIETELSLQKNKSTGIDVCYDAKWNFMQQKPDNPGKFQLSFLYHLSSHLFIALKALRV